LVREKKEKKEWRERDERERLHPFWVDPNG
jgi:hypothetical protein